MIIKFKTQFYNQIINKEKTQTIRYWKSCKLKNNDNIICDFGYNKINAIIENITYKTFNEITDNEIIADGFKSKIELLNTLKKFYSDFNENKKLYLIKFKIN